MDFTADFIAAFNHAMLYEVGPFWDPTDPDVIAGNLDTAQAQRKVGYTNTAGDAGGVTKYGVAQNENTDVQVSSLNLNQAMTIYFDRYWLPADCDKMPGPVTAMHFDTGVNLGISRAAKMIQQAVGADVDGQIGPQTLALINQQDQATLINALSKIRTDRYNAIVQSDPTQAKFLAGWLRRVSEVTQFALSQIQ